MNREFVWVMRDLGYMMDKDKSKNHAIPPRIRVFHSSNYQYAMNTFLSYATTAEKKSIPMNVSMPECWRKDVVDRLYVSSGGLGYEYIRKDIMRKTKKLRVSKPITSTS